MGLGVEFCLEVGPGRSAHAGAVRAAALRHEAWDDAVEGQAVIEAFADKFADMGNVARGEIGAQLDDDVTGGEGESKRV